MTSEYENSGFSLVELIIVIAVVAVLMGMLVPTYVRYVERTRTVKDENFADQIRESCETLNSDSKENLEVGEYVITITPNNDVTITSTEAGANPAHVDKYLKSTLGNDYAKTRITSKSYQKIQVTFSNTSRAKCDITYVK